MRLLLGVCLLAVLWDDSLAVLKSGRLRLLNLDDGGKTDYVRPTASVVDKHIPTLSKELESRLRSRRAVSDSANNLPYVYGEHSFLDGNPKAMIHYSGLDSPVIMVLTYDDTVSGQPLNAKLYRSVNYGYNFTAILDLMDDPEPALWNDFFVSPVNKQLVVFYHAVLPILYYSLDEGASWMITHLSPTTLDARHLMWSPANDRTALAHDPTTDQLYVTRDLGAHWTMIADHVDQPTDFQWGDPSFDKDDSLVYFNTYDPSDKNRGSFTVSLYTQHLPYTDSTRQEFDTSLGRHDDFILVGPYIFVQKTHQQNSLSLYTSYQRGKFQLAKLPTADAHQSYLVTHIDALQALVVIEHVSGLFNLYLSDASGVYFSLSLPDITHKGFVLDLNLVTGVNGTLVANQYVLSNPQHSNSLVRTLISLDNGANWELLRPPGDGGCSPPQCSLHLHMTTTAYARTGLYSQASAPGLILAHGTTGLSLSENPDLFISRDGGVSWDLTLQGSWGVTVADHGGLLVAARDYHHRISSQLQFSCDEGLSWHSFTFSSVGMTVFGVVTEPGQFTTIVSLYGLKQGTTTWDVVTVQFSPVFLRTCTGWDFYQWHPWDDRTGQGCILGSAVTIERRNASVCCLIGQDYSRPTLFSQCTCTVDDFECDYGYQHADGFTGECVRDDSVALPSSTCPDGKLTYTETRGFRQVAGDVCTGGVAQSLGPVTRSCCVGSALDVCTLTSPCSNHAVCSLGNNEGSYTCECEPGYSGDGFVIGSGCVNINECALDRGSLCANNSNSCVDTDGNFLCSCPAGYHGDGKAAGSGCSSTIVQPTSSSNSGQSLIPIVTVLGVLLVLALCAVVVMGVLIVWRIRKRRSCEGRSYQQVSSSGGVEQEGGPPSYSASVSSEPSVRWTNRENEDDEPLLLP